MISENKPATSHVKRIGELFVEAKILSEPDLMKGLDYSKKTGMPLGRVLVMLRLASDADLRAVLHIQSMMKFENMPANIAVRALQYMKEKSVHIDWACKQVGWQSEKFRNDLPPRLRELKEKLADCEQRLGADHPGVAECLCELAVFYEDEKMWAHAESCCQQAIEKLERLGPNDLRLAAACWRMANILFMQDRFDEAINFYQRQFEIKSNVLGADHPEVATALCDLAEVYDVQKKYSDAERYYLQALSIREKHHQLDEPAMVEMLRRLAFVCARRGRPPDSVMIGQLLTESGIISEDKIPEALAYGKEKGVPMARALIMLNHLDEESLRPVLHAQVLVKSNLLPGPLASRILRLCHKHRISIDEAMQRAGWKLQTTRSLHLSQLLKTNDDLIEAEKTLPPDHPEIATLCLQLADLYESYERYAEAEPLYKRALSIIEKVDDQSSQLFALLEKLAWVYVKQMKFEQAETIYMRVLELRRQVLGDEHQDLATSYLNLGRMHAQKGNHVDALAYFEKALPITEKAYGSTHGEVAVLVEQMAQSCYELGDFDKAEPLFWQAFRIKKEYEDLRSFEMVALLTRLAELYNKQGNTNMADSVLAMFQQQQDKSIFI